MERSHFSSMWGTGSHRPTSIMLFGGDRRARNVQMTILADNLNLVMLESKSLPGARPGKNKSFVLEVPLARDAG